MNAASPLGRPDGHRFLLLAGAAVTLAILVATSAGLWFYFDEWEVIRDRALDLDSLLRPHNEHFSAVLIAIHRGLIEVFGTTSYTPFLAALYATHLFLAATVYVLLREDGTVWQATAGTLIVLLPGAGGQNLVTAFQIGFLLATALGALALAMAPRRPGLAAGLLTVSVATQGVGLFYLAATAVRMRGDRRIVWLLVPVAVYAAWFAPYGIQSLGIHGSPAPASIPAYVAYGIATAFGQGYPVVGAMVIALVVVTIRGRARDRLVVASVVGLVSMFVITGAVRAQFGPEQATTSRYVSVALPFVLVIVLAAWRSACERYPIGRLGPWITGAAIVLGLIAFAMFRASWPEILASDPAL